MTIRDEDIRLCAAQAREVWLDSLPQTVPDHDFSKGFRRRVWLSRFRAYRLYYSRPFKRFLIGLGFWLLLNLLALALYPFESRANDVAFLHEADRMVVRAAEDFVLMGSDRLAASVRLPQTMPLSENHRTVELELSEIEFTADTSLYPLIYGGVYGSMSEIFAGLRLTIVYELDFYRDDTLLGTIYALTPRDTAALQDAQNSSSFRLLKDLGGHPVVFRKGSQYFTLHDFVEVIDPLLQTP